MGTLASGSIDLKGLKTAGKTATNFLAVDSSGVMIYDGSNGAQTPSNPSSNTKNVFIDSNSVDIRDGTSVLSTFGANSIDFYGDNGAVNLTHIGYASGQAEQGAIAEAPYYTFGTRDNGAIGNWSFAVGETNQASGSNSFAGGKLSVASNEYSFAFGRYALGDHETRTPTTASGVGSFAFGEGALASARHTFAFGNNPIASGNASGAFWGDATGNQAFTIHGTASGNRSFSVHGTASGDFGVALYGTASGYDSFALGRGTESQGYGQTVIGQYNIIQGTSSSRVNTDYAFIIGNGEADVDYLSRSNALTVDWNGNVNIASGAKYKINGSNLSASDVSAIPTSDKQSYSSASSLSWNSLSADQKAMVPTIQGLAYWNGAYDGRQSNLRYSVNGVIIGTSNLSSSGNNHTYSISANSTTNQSFTITRTGYYPICIDRINLGGTGSDKICLQKYGITARAEGSVTYEVAYYNPTATAYTSITVAVYVLWAKL